MKLIAYTNSEGNTSMVMPDQTTRMESETEEEFLARVIKRSVPAGARDVRVEEHHVSRDPTTGNFMLAIY